MRSSRPAVTKWRSKRFEPGAPSIVPIAVDVTDRDAMESIVKDLHIDVLINNAGIMPPLANFADMDISDIDATLEVNLSAAILLTRLVVPQMRERQSGHVVFTGSSAAHTAFPNVAVYSATKAALSGFAAALRADLFSVWRPRYRNRSGTGGDQTLQGHRGRSDACSDVRGKHCRSA
jgi:NADP-dependent 3-hydroxy acid dehydrogenase YdfG